MRKIILSTAALLAAVSIQAVETPVGVVTGQVKAMHILSDEDNGFTPNDGSGFLATLNYVSPELTTGLKVGASLYVNGDTGLTKWNETGIKNANGMFVAKEGKATTQLGQAYLAYANDTLSAKVGRQILNTPLTTIKWSLMPNFYEAAVVGGKVAKDTTLTLAHVSSMSHGSRSTADWGLIGEKTGTAGSFLKPESVGGTFEQAKFNNIGAAIGYKDTSGITAVNVAYTGIKNLKLSLWDYMAHDIANMLYADAAYKMPVAEGLKLSVNAQYLSQKGTGDFSAVDYSLMGTKIKLGNKKYSAYLAYSMSGDKGAFVNAWGSDPSYTSSLFSRNQYRQDVSAYKVGGHYAIMKGLKFMASYANYGQSAGVTTGTDATEADIILAYKPNKAWMVKIFNAIRVSEFDTATNDKTMNHIRMIGSYNF